MRRDSPPPTSSSSSSPPFPSSATAAGDDAEAGAPSSSPPSTWGGACLAPLTLIASPTAFPPVPTLDMTLSRRSDVDVPAIDDASSIDSLPSWTMTRRCMSCARDMSGWVEADSDDADGVATFFFFFGLAKAFLAGAVAVVVVDLFSSISIVGAIAGYLNSVFRCLLPTSLDLGCLFQQLHSYLLSSGSFWTLRCCAVLWVVVVSLVADFLRAKILPPVKPEPHPSSPS